MKPSHARKGVILGTAIGALLAGRAVIGWLSPSRGPAPKVENQLWVERQPRNDRDLVHHLILVEDKEKRIGVTGRGSRWRLEIDRVRWRRDERGRLEITFPQAGHHIHFDTRSWECKGEAPAPFELCLELSCEGKGTTLYSRREWKVGPREALPEDAAALPGVRSLVDAVTQVAQVPWAGEGDPTTETTCAAWPFEATP
jgi:hypothetical protein